MDIANFICFYIIAGFGLTALFFHSPDAVKLVGEWKRPNLVRFLVITILVLIWPVWMVKFTLTVITHRLF